MNGITGRDVYDRAWDIASRAEHDEAMKHPNLYIPMQKMEMAEGLIRLLYNEYF